MKKIKHFYVIEENIKDSKIFELKTFTGKDKYIKFNQNSLKEFLGKKSFKNLLKNGLFMNKKDRKYNAANSLQRLVGCLYSNITGLEMHHINKDKTNNAFCNIVPLESNLNKSIDSLPTDKMLKFGENMHQEWVKEINKKNKNTLSNNDSLILEILSNSIGKTAKAIHKIFKGKIKSIKVIYRILNTYFYTEEFLRHLKSNKINILDN